MSIVQFLRIIWARKLLIIATTLSCLLGALLVAETLSPRWEAHARVLLNTLKPDPATGQLMAGPTERNYAATQIELIKDYSVAGQVPPKLGWLTDPGLLEAYAHRSRHDVRDYRHWLAQIVIDGTKADLLAGSNILEITWTSADPNQAKAVVENLRQAYLDANLSLQRADALHDAQWNEDQANKARVALEQAQAAETNYERQNGIFMEDARTDIDTARLRALSTAGGPTMAITSASGPTPAMAQLSEVDASIAQARGRLGPNNPELQALEARRAALSAVAAQERSAQASASSGTGAGAAAATRALQEQKSRVLGESAKLAQLQQLQADVDLKRDQYNRIIGRVADLQQQAAVVSAGMTPLGVATTGNKATFPNKPLIVGGGLVLGFGVGFLLALLIELLGRRVRSADDLAMAAGAPLLAIVPTPPLGAKWRALGASSPRPTIGRGSPAVPV